MPGERRENHTVICRDSLPDMSLSHDRMLVAFHRRVAFAQWIVTSTDQRLVK
jgi:hypothetical protein